MKTTAQLKAEWTAARGEVKALCEQSAQLVDRIEREGKTSDLHAQLVALDDAVRAAEERAGLAGATYMAEM